jgi:hypothetical protein
VADLTPRTLIESIPDTDTVRLRLAEVIREASLLRSLLRLSRLKQEAAERDRIQREAVRHG